MNILIVTGIFPPDHGGPATYVPQIATALAARGHTVIGIITLADSTKGGISNYAFNVLRISRGLPKVIRFFRVIYAINRLSRRADVVYLNGLVAEGIIATKILARRRVVVKVVGDLIWEKAQNLGATVDNLDAFQVRRQPCTWQLLKRFQGWYTSKADFVITPSSYLSGVVQSWGVQPERIQVVYNSIDSSGIEYPTFEEPKFYDLVTVARLVPWKGLNDLMIIAAKKNWTLRIVGDGPMAEEIKQLISRLNAGSLISLAGQVSKHMVATEIQSGRIFVLNSSYEGLPHIVLEAQAAGVPVVASAAGGTPETIVDGENGYLVPVGDLDLLESRLQFLLENPSQRSRLATNALRKVNVQFSKDTMVSLTEGVLSKAVSRLKTKRP